jgi:transaldolase
LKIFIDTANIEEIKEINEMGFLAGVTTNPTLIAKEGRDYHQVIQEICGIVNGPISAESTRCYRYHPPDLKRD